LLKTSFDLERQKELEREEKQKQALFKETPDSLDIELENRGLYYNVLDKYSFKLEFYTTSIERPV